MRYGIIQIGILRVMDWPTIREAFKSIRLAKNKKQREFGGTVQAMVSKVENNQHKGPTVDTFVRAVIGLGMPVSQFFALIEERSEPAAKTRPLPQARLDEIEAERVASHVLRTEAIQAKERQEREDQERERERARSTPPVEPSGESRHPLAVAAEQSQPHPNDRPPPARKRTARRRLPPKRRRLGKKR